MIKSWPGGECPSKLKRRQQSGSLVWPLQVRYGQSSIVIFRHPPVLTSPPPHPYVGKDGGRHVGGDEPFISRQPLIGHATMMIVGHGRRKTAHFVSNIINTRLGAQVLGRGHLFLMWGIPVLAHGDAPKLTLAAAMYTTAMDGSGGELCWENRESSHIWNSTEARASTPSRKPPFFSFFFFSRAKSVIKWLFLRLTCVESGGRRPPATKGPFRDLLAVTTRQGASYGEMTGGVRLFGLFSLAGRLHGLVSIPIGTESRTNQSGLVGTCANAHQRQEAGTIHALPASVCWRTATAVSLLPVTAYCQHHRGYPLTG